MSVMERLGYVKKGRYEEIVSERDRLQGRITELEDDVRVLQEIKNGLEKRIEFLKMVVPSIRRIKNIGPRTAEKLERKGIKNVLDLIQTSPEKLSEVTGLSDGSAKKLIIKATNLIKRKA